MSEEQGKIIYYAVSLRIYTDCDVQCGDLHPPKPFPNLDDAKMWVKSKTQTPWLFSHL